jgi:drug/metabolite transporter (DMT)-like permease
LVKKRRAGIAGAAFLCVAENMLVLHESLTLLGLIGAVLIIGSALVSETAKG